MPLSSFSQTEVIFTERKRMDGPLLWTVWLSAVTFSLAEGRWFYLIAATFGVAVNMLAVRRGKELYVHRVFVGIGVMAATAILAIEILTMQSQGGWILSHALGHYIILLQMCKLFQQKRNRDYTQLLALSGLLMIAAGMMTHEPWYAVLLAVYVVLLCHTAMVFTLKRGLDGIAKSRLATDADLAEVSRVAWSVSRAWPGGAMFRRTVLILTAVAATGAGVFLITPRGEPVAPKFLAAAVTGFSNEVTLGDVTGQIYQSNAVLMHVRLGDSGGQIPLTDQARYLRGGTFNRYQDSRWSNSAWSKMNLDRDRADDTDDPQIDEKELFDGGFTEHVSMDSSLVPYLFVSFPAGRLASGQDVLSIMPDFTFRLSPDKATPKHVSYTVRCLPYPLTEDQQKWLEAQTGLHRRGDPSRDVEATEPVRELAQQWCADLIEQREQQPANKDQLDLAIAGRIAANLKRDYSYTLDLTGVDPLRDGVEDFLLYMKSGHCEYFASAMTVMCRLLGVQARLVTGFVMHEYDADAGHYIVRGRDAHAWTEVYTPSGFWQVVDATPPGGRQMHGRVWAASVRQYWNDLKFLWYEKVVGYDAPARDRALAAFKKRLGQISATLRASITNLIGHGIVDRALVHVAIIAGLIGLVGEALLIRRWVRRASKTRKLLPIPPKKLAFINKLLSLLERQGFALRAEQTLSDLVAEASAGSDLPAGPLRELVGLYYRIRWGQLAPTARELQDAEGKVESLRQLLQG